MNKNLTFAFLLGILSLGFVACGDDGGEDLPTIIETAPMYQITMEDGVTYQGDTTYIRRVADGEAATDLSIRWPADAYGTKDVGYGQVVKYTAQYRPTGFYYFGNKLLMLLDTYHDYGLPGYAYRFAKDLSSYEVKEIVGGKPSLWDNDKLAIFGYGTEYALYDTSFNILAAGKVDAYRFDHNDDDANKIAFGTYKGEYYALVNRVYLSTENDSTCVLNMTTGKLSPLKIKHVIWNIGYLYPDEENKPRTEYAFSFNEDHFEVTYNVTFYSGEKTTVVRKFDLDGNEITE